MLVLEVQVELLILRGITCYAFSCFSNNAALVNLILY